MLENTLDYVRIALYTLLIILVFFLYQAWNNDHPKKASVTPDNTQLEVPSSTAPNPSLAIAPAAQTNTVVSTPIKQATGQLVQVNTDLMQATINTAGGNIVSIQLLKYPESLGSTTPFLLLTNEEKNRYVAESGLLSQQGPDTTKEQAVYSVSQTQYELLPGQEQIKVNLTWNNHGLTVTKTYTFTRNSYEINLNYDVVNHSSSPWLGNLYTQLMRTNTPPPSTGGLINLSTYFGAAISSSEKPFEKIPFKDMQEKSLNKVIQGGWAAMIQHYFISAWIPSKDTTSTYYSRVTPSGLYTIGMISQPVTVSPGESKSIIAKLYTGPAVAERLEKAAPSLQLTIDYGWFWWISGIIFWMMQKIYEVIGNWGWSIVIVTIIIKILFYGLSNKSYRSMSAMKRLQPKIEALRGRYGNDKKQLTEATMNLYREEKVNPMSGCLPILIQVPVFIALYWVLVESVQLRQAPFILWIQDLSKPDPYYVLPILMGISMFLQQRLNPPSPDPLQTKIMMFMPVIFTVAFINFPSGLMLYWFVNNTLSFLQQWHMMHRVEKENTKKKAKA